MVVVVGMGDWGLLVVLLLGVFGGFGGCWCCVGSLLAWSGSEVLGWWRRFCSWGVSGFHALHCCKLSCVWVAVMLVRRVLFLLLFCVVFLLVGRDVVVGVAVVRVVVLCLCVPVVFPGFCLLDVGSSCVGCVGFVASGVGFCRGRLRVVSGGGCGVSVVLVLSLIRWD